MQRGRRLTESWIQRGGNSSQLNSEIGILNNFICSL